MNSHPHIERSMQLQTEIDELIQMSLKEQAKCWELDNCSTAIFSPWKNSLLKCAKKREEPFKANVTQRLGRNGPQKKGNTPSVSPC